MGKRLQGFMEFIRSQGVVGLAIGLSIGTAVTVFIKSIVDNIFNPIIGALLPGGSQLNNKFVCLSHGANGACTNKLSWGIVLTNFISFVLIAALIYFVVMGLGFDKFDVKKDEDK